MSELLGMSFDASASPAIRIKAVDEERYSGDVPTGWGFAWYPTGEHGAAVVKDPLPRGDTALSRVLRDWERFRGFVFVCHIRGAAKIKATQENTHPFSRSYAGRDWLFAHNGTLSQQKLHTLSLGNSPIFEPVGRTDSEYAFCWLMTQIRGTGARSLGDLDWPRLHGWFGELNSLGTFNAIISDGQDLVAFCDKNGFNGLHFVRRRPPYIDTKMANSILEIDVGDPLDINRTMVLVATTPVSESGWEPIEQGGMIVVRRGAITWQSNEISTSDSDAIAGATSVSSGDAAQSWTETQVPQAAGNGSHEIQASPPASLVQEFPMELQPQSGASVNAASQGTTETESRILTIIHETTYRYEQPVERSTHLFRMRPVHDINQEVLDYSLEIGPDGESAHFEDVFGNQTTRMKIRKPYTALSMVSRSRVRIRKDKPLASSAKRSAIPLVWMPWQRQMMQAYLLPPELPETQLRELSDFAMSFVERQDYDLLETLNDINRTIRNDFVYVSRSTTLETTAFDVYVNRRGVCQDFANLFICLARLLGVPARYRAGYIYTGGDYQNKIQSDASHAWVEVYLPWAGWRGYDPTNGCLANLDHVRVAVGRNFRDATPTSGTIFKGGGGETLSASVKVELEPESTD